MCVTETSSLVHESCSSNGIQRENNSISGGFFRNLSRVAAFLFFLVCAVVVVVVVVVVLPTVSGRRSAILIMSDNHNETWYHSWEMHLLQTSKLDVLGHVQQHALTSNPDERKLNDLLYFNHSAAYQELKTSVKSSAQDFYHYQEGWEAQVTQSYCAVATSAAALNSLRGKIDLPQDEIYIPYPWATQNALLLNEQVKQHIFNVQKTKRLYVGLGLSMAASLLNYNLNGQGYMAEAHSVDPTTFEKDETIKMIKKALLDDKMRVVINYDRGGIGQGPYGHGHFSPLGAYNEELDAFLVMDVAKYKYPPVWVPSAKVFNAISTLDTCANFTYTDRLPDFKTESFLSIEKELGCQEAHRGFIIIKPDS